ncbi:MAG: peroxide stress protein YaaA [Alphaproteobacteria bacterium]|nr:peroxide stress protein YaaA [Alphaproteobacteria bacterium]
MLAILSPAKSLDTSPVSTQLQRSAPVFAGEAAKLLKVARRLSADDLKGLMHISDALAELNRERFQSMAFPLEEPSSLPAALLFDGDVYKGLDARSLPDDDLAWANDHVRILSGLYGLLRPMDLAHPYRLEMGTSLENPRGKDLYAWWGDRLAKKLDEDLKGHADRVVVDLASKEYNRAVPSRALKADRLDVQFKELRDGKARVISFFAKKARGTFARWMVQNRIERRDDLKGFDADGYAYSDELSSASSWVFIRSS